MIKFLQAFPMTRQKERERVNMVSNKDMEGSGGVIETDLI